MLTYTDSLHTGRNKWSHEFQTRLLSAARIWITCNGERVDMRTMGFPHAYLTSVPAALTVLDTMDAREARA